MQIRFRPLMWIPAALATSVLSAPPASSPTDAFLDASKGRWEEVSDRIWDYSETALQEKKSAELLAGILEKEGFTVTRGVAGMPTAFVASAGSGAPVVGILAEYDALPGLSQKGGEAQKSPRVAGGAGQGCGHNLFGAADGAALATETAAKVTVLGGTREPIYNDALSRAVQKELDRVGPPRFDASDVALAKAIQKEIGIPETGLVDKVLPYGPGHGGEASSDIGEVSAALPLAELSVVTGPADSPWHHWAVTSCSASPIGRKGMLVAAKVLAATTVDLLNDPKTVDAAKAEFVKSTGGRPYVSPLAKDAVPKTY